MSDKMCGMSIYGHDGLNHTCILDEGHIGDHCDIRGLHWLDKDRYLSDTDRIAQLNADLTAARRERDKLRQEQEQALRLAGERHFVCEAHAPTTADDERTCPCCLAVETNDKLEQAEAEIATLRATLAQREQEERGWQWRHTVLRCVKCERHCSLAETWFRTFNEGRCGNCGGAFVVAHIPKAEQADPIAQGPQEPAP